MRWDPNLKWLTFKDSAYSSVAFLEVLRISWFSWKIPCYLSRCILDSWSFVLAHTQVILIELVQNGNHEFFNVVTHSENKRRAKRDILGWVIWNQTFADSFGPPAHLCQIKSTWRCLIKIIWDSGVFSYYHLPAMVAFGWENTVWGIWRRTSAVRVSPLGGFVPGLSPWKPLETDDGKSGTANCEDKELFETWYSACFGPRNRFHDMSHEFSRMIFA